MDILTHGLTGLAASTVLMPYTNGNWQKKLGIASLGLLGGLLPDVDVISKWRGFDATFGTWFGLTERGDVIFGQTHWYSHHVFTHSIIGALFFTLLLVGVYFMVKRKQHSPHLKLYALAFLLAYLGHLFEDMLTPGGPWKGIAFFWPSAEFSGGWGKIWWWNNYDLFLIVLASFLINGLILLGRYQTKWLSKLTLLVAMLLFTVQIERRNHNYNHNTYQQNATAAQKAQQRFLGATLYNWMNQLDRQIPVAF